LAFVSVICCLFKCNFDCWCYSQSNDNTFRLIPLSCYIFVWTHWDKYACNGNDLVLVVFVCFSVTASQASEASDASREDGEEDEEEEDPDYGDAVDQESAEESEDGVEDDEDAEDGSDVEIISNQSGAQGKQKKRRGSTSSFRGPATGGKSRARVQAKKAASKPSPTRLRQKTSPKDISMPGVLAFTRGKANCQMCDRKDPSWVTTCASKDRHR
jgi:hypothetical protein